MKNCSDDTQIYMRLMTESKFIINASKEILTTSLKNYEDRLV